MSLLWTTALNQVEAAKPIPTKAENIASHLEMLGQHGAPLPHEMHPDEFAAHRSTLWHGSPNGVAGMNRSNYGVHVGTQEAARQALNARIGTPAHGDWDGTTEYGKTPLTQGSGTGYSMGMKPDETSLPTGKATYSTGHPIPMDVKPHLFPTRIVGGMTNTPHTPHEDFKANSLMAGQIKRGTARNGYFYTNEGEDAGSISAVVPSADHLATHEDFVQHAHAHGMHVPQHNRDRYGL